MALVLVSLGAAPSVSLALVGGIAIVLGLAVLIAHLANPKLKRIVAAALVAVIMATVLPAIVQAEDEGDDGVVMQNTCSLYEPWSPMWILLGCMWP